MAVTSLVPTRMGDFNTVVTTPTSAAVGADGMEIDYSGKDFKILLSVDTATATVKAGNGIQGVADLEVASGKSVVLDSGMFKNVSGTHKGKVYITGATAKVAAIELP
jgi:hypothetical protein